MRALSRRSRRATVFGKCSLAAIKSSISAWELLKKYRHDGCVVLPSAINPARTINSCSGHLAVVETGRVRGIAMRAFGGKSSRFTQPSKVKRSEERRVGKGCRG